MSKIAYIDKKFRPDSLQRIATAEAICADYAAQGYDLTLRQLYYQHVARGLIPNRDSEYKRLGELVNDARLAGLIDWDHLVDRTRNLASLSTWSSPASIMRGAAYSYREDKWADQPEYVEVWVEKEALAGVVARPADRWQVPYFSCRGYVSQSEMHAAAQRLRRIERLGRKVTIIHLGDHDPSGLDMTRDIGDRLYTFLSGAEVERIALNLDQVQQYNPPPNPAKVTDARYEGYREQYGEQSWELDALDPATLDALVDGAIGEHLDRDLYEAAREGEQERRGDLESAADRWSEVVAMLHDEEE